MCFLESSRFLLTSFTLLCFLGGNLVLGGPPKDYWEAGVEKNNEYRAIHGVPLVTLDTELAERADKCAQYYAELGTIDHSCKFRGDPGKNGECLWHGNPHQCNGSADVVRQAFKRWYDEVEDYDFKKNGARDGKVWWNIGHFTQITWKNSKRLGTGYAQGKNMKCYVVAIHSPPGNYPGKYGENVFPPVNATKT